jgi:hypothetical protein
MTNVLLFLLVLHPGLVTAGASPAPNRIAILNEPGMPTANASSQPEILAQIFTGAGFQAELQSAAQFADPQQLNAARIDLVVIPTGEAFPAQARANFLQYLRDGGDFISLGGYAFRRLLSFDGQSWVSEASRLEVLRQEALRREHSLLPDGSFEATRNTPLGGVVADGQWRRDGETAVVVADSAIHGAHCGSVSLPSDQPSGSSTFYLDLSLESQQAYEIVCHLKSKDVTGGGMAYAAVYQHAADGQIVEFRDFAVLRGTTDWSEAHYTFAPNNRVTRVRIQCGLYNATGTAWFDDIRLAKVTGLECRPMNTATGVPADGLETRPEQLGVFDASFPLQRVRRLRTAAGQHVVAPGISLEAELSGWAASGVVGDNNARWIPLLETFDRYDRPRGAAAAALLHYHGHYRGSAWAFFGVDNLDLCADPDGPVARALQQTARFVSRELFLHSLHTDQRLYRQGEPVDVSVVVSNQGTVEQKVHIELALAPLNETASSPEELLKREEVIVAPGREQTISCSRAAGRFANDLCRVVARLEVNGSRADEVETGFVVEDLAVHQAAAPSRFVANYFTRGDRPLFLFGTDTYSYTYLSAFDNPLTWARDHRAARDIGLQVYENLQYSQAEYRLTEADWRAFRAMAQLTQKYNLDFMPGMLIGQNVVTSDAQRNAQSGLCAEYSRRLSDTPALHYYINGDYRLDLAAAPEVTRQLWNEWLATRYGQAAALSQAWGVGDVGSWGQIGFPPPATGRWDDVAAIDRARFEVWLTRRWNEAHVAAVRRHDAVHPIMSEYYQRPSGGLDLPLTIDGQDVADIGYFDEPINDIDKLPLAIRFNDLRVRGKGVALGEYGVKTHPAWTVANGATGYHIQRTEEEQKQLFLAVGHYALGLGAAKVQNWCLADSQNRVFPWGLFSPNQLIPKNVAYVHRNQSVIWRFFSPRSVPSELTLCLPNGLRLGNRGQLGLDVAYRAIEGLLASHLDFNVVDDSHLDQLPPATRVLLYPAPFVLDDRAFRQLLAWVQGGGTLIVTGDLSYDEDRQPTQRERLPNILGVHFLAANYPHVERQMGPDEITSFAIPELTSMSLRPCLRTSRGAAEVLGQTAAGLPVLTRHRVGTGCVYWLADPLELDGDPAATEKRSALYSALTRLAGLASLPLDPPAAWLHALVQPTVRGRLHVVFNRQRTDGSTTVGIETAAGPVRLEVRNRWPALAAVTNEGRVVAVNAFGRAGVQRDSLLAGSGLKAALSLDGLDLRQSRAVLFAPFEVGTLAIPPRAARWQIQFGEFRNGNWTVLEQLPLTPEIREITLDADRATCLVLLCEPDHAGQWQSLLSDALLHPERIAGY